MGEWRCNMVVSLIVAMDKNGLIGKDGKLPWPRLDADMKHFRSVTRGKPVIMGRKTFDSLPGGPLKGRLNIVLTRRPSFRSSHGCMVAHSVEEVLAQFHESKEIVVIGGAEIYRLFLPHAQKMYITYVHGEFTGDTHFPLFDEGEWENVHSTIQVVDSKNPFVCTFKTLIRKPV